MREKLNLIGVWGGRNDMMMMMGWQATRRRRLRLERSKATHKGTPVTEWWTGKLQPLFVYFNPPRKRFKILARLSADESGRDLSERHKEEEGKSPSQCNWLRSDKTLEIRSPICPRPKLFPSLVPRFSFFSSQIKAVKRFWSLLGMVTLFVLLLSSGLSRWERARESKKLSGLQFVDSLYFLTSLDEFLWLGWMIGGSWRLGINFSLYSSWNAERLCFYYFERFIAFLILTIPNFCLLQNFVDVIVSYTLHH